LPDDSTRSFEREPPAEGTTLKPPVDWRMRRAGIADRFIMDTFISSSEHSVLSGHHEQKRNLK
jgi:hypothetical protein